MYSDGLCLQEVPENQRADAASSLVYEANARIRDPVYGCLGAISSLQQQLEALQSELNAVRDACSIQQQALMRKSMVEQQHQQQQQPQNVVVSSGLMGYQNQNDRLSVVATGGLAGLTTIYAPHHNERLQGAPGNLSSQPGASPDYTVPSPNGVGTPEAKERTYWTNLA